MSEKLQKVLAHAGKGSRREIEEWITQGRIQVNGRSAKLGDRVDPADRILVDGEPVYIRLQKSSHIKALIYHKPEGEIVSRSDPMGRPTVFENLPAIADSRWVSIGRLDINTSGLLLFTNNGELANKLMHPSTGLDREYLARVRGRLDADEITKLTRTGIELDGKLARFESVNPADMGDEGSNHWYRVVIKEGRYREVRRLFEDVGHVVSRLKRIRYGSIKLTRDIKLGQFSKMAPLQLEKLIASADLVTEFGDRSSKNKMRSSSGTRRDQFAHKQSSDGGYEKQGGSDKRSPSSGSVSKRNTKTGAKRTASGRASQRAIGNSGDVKNTPKARAGAARKTKRKVNSKKGQVRRIRGE